MNTREKLSWTLLGAVVFFGIAAVSTDTSFFKNASLTGWLSLSGETNRLTVADGALELDGEAVGGTSGDPFVITSQLANNETNIALLVNSSNSWSDGWLLQLSQKNTNALQVGPNGGLYQDKWEAWWGGYDPDIALIAARGVAQGSTSDRMVIDLYAADDLDSATKYSDFFVENNYGNGSDPYVYMYGDASLDGLSISSFDLQATASGRTLLNLRSDNVNGFVADPKIAHGQIPFIMRSTRDRTNSFLVKIQDDDGAGQPVDLFSIAFDGATTIAQSADEPAAPDAGYFTLFATNNAGKMVLKVKFPTGASQVIATEP